MTTTSVLIFVSDRAGRACALARERLMILVQPDAETDIGTQLAHRNRARGNRRDSARQASAPVRIRAGECEQALPWAQRGGRS